MYLPISYTFPHCFFYSLFISSYSFSFTHSLLLYSLLPPPYLISFISPFPFCYWLLYLLLLISFTSPSLLLFTLLSPQIAFISPFLLLFNLYSTVISSSFFIYHFPTFIHCFITSSSLSLSQYLLLFTILSPPIYFIISFPSSIYSFISSLSLLCCPYLLL